MAILTTPDLDATTVDAETVRFGPDQAQPSQYALEDVDGDGDLDLILHFRTQDSGIAPGGTSAMLVGWTYADGPIIGLDSVRIVPAQQNKRKQISKCDWHYGLANDPPCGGRG